MANIKAPEERRSHNITMRLTMEELKIVDDEAEKRQCTRTDVMRDLIDKSTFAQEARFEG